MESQTNNHIISENMDSYEKLSELNDMKQHADKIIQGIKKLEENDANRAIWELFQNAVDLSPECIVKIKITEDTFSFSHNGAPFTPMTLDCLFKQVSSKTLEEKKLILEEGEPVGQYGTGFITSHSFGNELIIESALVKEDGFVPIQNFIIDRRTDNWKELGERIRQLKKKVGLLLNEGLKKEKPYPVTTFTYKTVTKHNRECSKNAIESLRLLLPYVMTLNPRLKEVTVCDIDRKETIYKTLSQAEEPPLSFTSISINDQIQKVYYLQSTDKRIVVILPFSEGLTALNFEKELPRLFIYYPLIGTQTFGINYVIHSRHFQPTEPRNGLYLQSENENNNKEEKANRDIVLQASQMIFDFFKLYSTQIKSPINLAAINFNINSDKTILNKYFQDLKTTWINEFKCYPLVETSAGNIQPSETLFIHDELLHIELSEDDENYNAIYSLVNKFWKNIPKKHLIKEWTKIIDEWSIESIKYIQIKDVVEKIQESGNLSAFDSPKDLKQFYKYLIKNGHSELYNYYKLLPNIKGELRQLVGKDGLNSSLNLPLELILIADVIMPDIPKRLVHPDFKFDLEFTPYSRKNYATEVNDYIAKLLGEKVTSTKMEVAFLNKLIDYCKIATSIDSNSIPSQMIKLICRYYKQSEELIAIPAIKEDILDNSSSQERLLKKFLNDITNCNSEWVSENISFLKNVVSIGHDYSAYENIFQTLKVFPNQLNELTEQSYLSFDDNIPKHIKDLFDTVVKSNFPIRSSLVHSEFADFLKNKTKKTSRNLTEKIESKFFDDQLKFSINEHPFKKEIIGLLEEMKVSHEYTKYFPLLYSKRSSILVELADGEDTFSILSLDPSRIKKLAELGNNPNFDQIVKLGLEALIKKKQDDGNFKHKYTIGTHIENILRDNLTRFIPENIKAVIEDVQDGQDIIIKIDEIPVYFIEVKSRWDVNNPIRMSKNQTIRANEQKNNYALCSVDMTKYLGDNKYNIQNIGEIRNCIRFNIDIGTEVLHLIDILIQTNDPNTIHLDGDFRTLVPMKFIDKGIELNEFEKYLIATLSKAI